MRFSSPPPVTAHPVRVGRHTRLRRSQLRQEIRTEIAIRQLELLR